LQKRRIRGRQRVIRQVVPPSQWFTLEFIRHLKFLFTPPYTTIHFQTRTWPSFSTVPMLSVCVRHTYRSHRLDSSTHHSCVHLSYSSLYSYHKLNLIFS
jgi:hypothetical protein